MSSRGFSLVELMVVTSIISLLSSIVVSTTNTARTAATNSSTQSFLQSFNQVMEAFYADYGRFPESVCAGGLSCRICKSETDSRWPPPDMASYSLKLPTTISGLAHVGGCATLWNNGPNAQQLDFSFYLVGNSEEEAERLGKPLMNTYQMNYNPCEWYDTDLISCHVQVIH
jgi:prepilin-type N-terminal cleavage/methylation domain-containing protein